MAVGASVLYFQGEPFKKGYRHFKIRGIEGSDDYRMMSQVILRHYGRLLDEKKNLPQLVVIDGGKGHLRAASKALEDLDLLEKMDIIAIAKGKDRNNIFTDEIFSKNFKEPISFPVDSPLKFLLQRIRNEAHRFAIAYHRKLRKKGGLSSILDGIAGIGEKRKKSLIKHFGGVAGIKEASLEEINKAPFISEKIAQRIKAKI
jgi:excinuclease ABC subunit C